MTRWNELFFFFFKYDSKNWFFWQEWLKELNVFLKKDISQRTDFSMTQRIEFFSMQRIELFFCLTQRIEPFYLQKWRKELSLFSVNMTQRIELFLICLKELSFFFSIWLKELNFFPSIWLKELILFLKLDSKGWTFLLSMTQRIEPFFWIWLKESITFGKGAKIF